MLGPELIGGPMKVLGEQGDMSEIGTNGFGRVVAPLVRVHLPFSLYNLRFSIS
jgi:hypothetical protein